MICIFSKKRFQDIFNDSDRIQFEKKKIKLLKKKKKIEQLLE